MNASETDHNPIIARVADATRAAKPSRVKRGLHLHACGLNHVRAAVEVREQYALSPEQARDFLQRLHTAGATQALVLSTCNRTEVYAFSTKPAFAQTLRKLFLALNQAEPAAGPPPVYEYAGPEAVRHLFAVGAGLDSLILGENQIKQQIQQAWELTQQTHLAGSELKRLVDAAHRCGKRIRTETELNVGTLCVGKAAVLRGEQVLGGLAGRVCLVIGAGKVGRIAARAIAERKPSRLIILNRTLQNAQELARELADEMACEAYDIEALPTLLPAADFILGAAYAPELILDWELYHRVADAPHRPERVCLIDAAVPRIFDPALARLAWVELLDIEQMSEIIEVNRQRRTVAARDAWQIVEEETEKYRAALLNAELAPVIQRLTREFDAIVEAELPPPAFSDGTAADTPSTRDHAAPDDRTDLLRRRLKQRLLHAAITELKTLAETRN
jgi:glutamyl-tRNA reductase